MPRSTSIAILAMGLLLTFSQSGYAQEAVDISSTSRTALPRLFTAEHLKGDWSLGLGGISYSEGKDEGAAAYFKLKAKFDWTLTKWMKVRVSPYARFFSARVQERYDDDDYTSAIWLDEAYLSIQPIEEVEFRGGAINQKYFKNNLLVSRKRSFPGGQLILSKAFGNIKVKLVGEDVVPTSYSLNTERATKEALPSFSAESAHISGPAFEFVNWELVGGHFNWTNIPSIAAFHSGIDGNNTDGADEAGSRLRYGMDGFFGSLDLCLCFKESPVQFSGGYKLVHNSMAPNGLNNARMIGGGPRLIFGDRIFDFFYYRYYIEQDATVAAYNTSALGKNNREGDYAGFRMDFVDLGFVVLGEFVNAVPIRDRPSQFTLTEFRLGVETNYVSF